MGVEGDLLIAGENVGHGLGVIGRDALRSVHGGQLSTLGIRVFGDLLTLDLKFALDQFVLGPDRDQLPGGHGEGTGKKSCHSSQAHGRCCRTGPRNSEDERHVGDQSVARSEDGGTRRSSLDIAVAGVVAHVSAGDPGRQSTEGKETNCRPLCRHWSISSIREA